MMRLANGFLGIAAVVVLSLVAPPSAAGQPTTRIRPETIQAYDRYVRSVEREVNGSLRASSPPAWIDVSGAQKASVRSGEILTQHVDTDDVDVPGGMIHDWIGVAFIPGATAADTIAFLQDVGKHKDYYDEVLEARLLERDGDTIRSFLRLRKHKVLTVVLDTEHESRYRPIGDGLWFMSSHATRINEVKDAGSARERKLPEGEDSGFLWRLTAFWRIQEAAGGTWVEFRTVSLSRGIPFGLGVVIRPFITSVPKESLVSTLSGTRAAVQK